MERTVSNSHYKGNQMNAKLFSISLLAAGVLLASASQSNASGYTLTYLGTLGGDYSWVHAINNSGQVVGMLEGYSRTYGSITYGISSQ